MAHRVYLLSQPEGHCTYTVQFLKSIEARLMPVPLIFEIKLDAINSQKHIGLMVFRVLHKLSQFPFQELHPIFKPADVQVFLIVR